MDANRMWDEFCDDLREAGHALMAESAPRTPLDEAEGVRYLIRLLRYASINAIEHADPRWPQFSNALDPNLKCKIGADNPDNIYMRANVSGRYRYRISGTRGTVPVLTFGSKANRYHVDGTMVSTGELNAEDLTIDADGRFSFVASADRPESGDWLPLTEETTNITGRQSFQDRASERPAEVRIELLGTAAEAEPLDPGRFRDQLRMTTRFVRGTATTFAGWTRRFMSRPNELPDWGQEGFQAAGGDPAIFYLHGYWTLADDEAWVIETEVPDCEYWNFVLQNRWMESLDHDRMNIHVNNHTGRLNDDGTLTIVVSAADPGYGNWISTGFHHEGTALLRWVGATSHPLPTTRVVRL